MLVPAYNCVGVYVWLQSNDLTQEDTLGVHGRTELIDREFTCGSETNQYSTGVRRYMQLPGRLVDGSIDAFLLRWTIR